MKQRFSWTALLLLTACLVRSSLGEGEKCDSNGIVGTFNQSGELDSLTITPVEYDKTLNVSVSVDVDNDDRSVQIYMTVAEDSKCPKGSFDIVYPTDEKKMCSISYSYNKDTKTITINDKDSKPQNYVLDFSDPYQASFEVRVEGNAAKLMALISSGDEVELSSTADCLQRDDPKTTKFKLNFNEDFVQTDECGVQFEMKGKYKVVELLKGKDSCTLEPAGSSGDGGTDDPNGQDGTTTTAAQPTTNSFPTWAWGAIGGGILLLLLILVAIGIVIYCFCIKKKGSDEDVEAAPEDEPDIQPTNSTATGAEQSGVDPTQQTPNDKPEGNAEDKPEDKTEEKTEDKPEDE